MTRLSPRLSTWLRYILKFYPRVFRKCAACGLYWLYMSTPKSTHPEHFLCFLTSVQSCCILADDLPPGPAYFLTAAKTGRHNEHEEVTEG